MKQILELESIDNSSIGRWVHCLPSYLRWASRWKLDRGIGQSSWESMKTMSQKVSERQGKKRL